MGASGMNTGDIVRYRSEGRAYLGVITEINRKVRVRFANPPLIRGHRSHLASFLKAEFTPYGKGGVMWVIKEVTTQ
jgi:hypothetical protein